MTQDQNDYLKSIMRREFEWINNRNISDFRKEQLSDELIELCSAMKMDAGFIQELKKDSSFKTTTIK